MYGHIITWNVFHVIAIQNKAKHNTRSFTWDFPAHISDYAIVCNSLWKLKITEFPIYMLSIVHIYNKNKIVSLITVTKTHKKAKLNCSETVVLE